MRYLIQIDNAFFDEFTDMDTGEKFSEEEAVKIVTEYWNKNNDKYSWVLNPIIFSEVDE